MKNLFKLPVLCAALFLVGCNTQPVNHLDAKKTSYIFIKSPLLDDKESSSITFIRDKGFYGSGCRMLVLINGKTYASLNTGEKYSHNLAFGSHIIGIKPSGKGFCGDSKRELKIDVVENSHKFFRVGMDASGSLIFDQTFQSIDN